MPTEIYEVVAQGARYWFLFLMVLIVWRSYRWYVKDRKQRKKRLRLLPDAGYIGEMVVIKGNDNLTKGTALPVPGEGTLGFNRMNDLYVPVAGVAKQHCLFWFTPGEGLTLRPGYGRAIKVDDQERVGRREPLTMAHGSRLYIGEAELRLRLFAGFEAAAPLREESPAQQQNDSDASAVPQAPPIQQPPVMTREQFAQWQQQAMQQQAMQQQYMRHMYSQWLAQQQPSQPDGSQAAAGQGSAPNSPACEPDFNSSECLSDGERLPGRECLPGRERHPGGQFANDGSRSPAPLNDGSYNGADDLAATDDGYDAAASGYDYSPPGWQTDFDHDAAFYPPAMDDSDPEDGFWAYAAYPSAEDEGHEDAGGGSPLDEDLTDASVPPRSAYIGHDDAEEAKKRFWDRYLGGGGSRE